MRYGEGWGGVGWLLVERGVVGGGGGGGLGFQYHSEAHVLWSKSVPHHQ